MLSSESQTEKLTIHSLLYALLLRYTGQVSRLPQDERLLALDRDWSDAYEVPGHQQTLLVEPNVSQLAQELSGRLMAAQQRYLSTEFNRGSYAKV